MLNAVNESHGTIEISNEFAGLPGFGVYFTEDITNLNGKRLYPTMIWLLTQTVNQMPEFRTTLTDDGPGYFDTMHPAYTIFNQEQKTFSGMSIRSDRESLPARLQKELQQRFSRYAFVVCPIGQRLRSLDRDIRQFTLIDLENWERREHYLHFLNEVRCSYSVSVNLEDRPRPAVLFLPADDRRAERR